MSQFVKINKDDDVVVLLEDGVKGKIIDVDGEQITLLEDTPKGHKVAIKEIKKDNDVLKYGYSIGKAKEDIKVGQWIHSHNMRTGLDGILEYDFKENTLSQEKSHKDIFFKGYVRDNGEVGIRNEIWIINTVGCINKTCTLLAKEGQKLLNDKVDGIYNFEHPHGCSQLGDDLENTKKIEEGMKLIEELVYYASKFEREVVHISKLKIGLKCGGSDAFSGITANPLLGRLSDEIIRLGGTSIQTEVPEMFGAETILFDRAIDKDVFDRSVHLINDFKEYFIRYDQVIYENPSPGNKKGGITTLEEKSLGCVQKGGKSIVTDVLRYGDKSTKTGLNLLYGPGNDQVAVTVLAAAGAHMVLFTTGRGTPFGGTVPTLKISTNTDLYNKKKHWIDFNAGQILEDHDFESLDESFFKMIVDTASGEYVAHNEKNGYKEISILKDGVTL